MTFEFVADPKFKELLQRDYKELKACLKIPATKSVLVLSGSIIEAMLIEYFLQFMPAGQTAASIYKLTFEQLLDLAESQGLLTKREKNLAWVIKDYRNLIHPGREIRKAEKFSIDDANISHSLIGIVSTAIEDKYKQTYGYVAEDIIQKLKNDWQFRSVFDKVVIKLNQTERVKLLSMLIKAELYDKSFWDTFLGEGEIPEKEHSNLDSTKEFVVAIKPLVPHEIIIKHLKQLVNEIETGDQTKAFILFNLFHEELSYLSKDEVDMVVVYIFSLFSSILEHSSDLAEEKTFSTIGNYIASAQTQKALIEFGLFCAVNFGGKKFQSEIELFDQVYNALSNENKALLQAELTSFLSPVENLPSDIKDGFFKEMLARGIIKA